MNKTIITHATWLVVAAGAFAGGMAIKGNSESKDSDRDVSLRLQDSKGGLSAIGSPKTKDPKGAEEGGGTASGSSAFGAQRSNPVLIADYLASSDDLEKNLLFAQLLVGLNADNAQDIYDSLKDSLTGREGGQRMRLLFQAWGKVDGAAAIAAATEGAENGGRGRGPGGRGDSGWNIGSVLSGWASVDSEAAKGWIDTVEDERQRGMYTFGLVNGMAKSDPDGATDYVIQLAAAQEASGEEPMRAPWGGGSMTERYIDMIASEQLKQGASAATTWADSLPDGDLKSSAFDQIAESYVGTDLEAAKDWVASYADKDYAQRAIREVAEQLAREDPQTALEWGDSLPAEAQESTYAEVMGRWTRENAEEASTFLASMDETAPARDAAVQSLANALIYERDSEKRDPESAAVWATTIGDEEARVETVTNAVRSWMRSDAEAAAAWLPQSGLPPETQTEILATPARDDRGGRGGRGGR